MFNSHVICVVILSGHSVISDEEESTYPSHVSSLQLSLIVLQTSTKPSSVRPQATNLKQRNAVILQSGFVCEIMPIDLSYALHMQQLFRYNMLAYSFKPARMLELYVSDVNVPYLSAPFSRHHTVTVNPCYLCHV